MAAAHLGAAAGLLLALAGGGPPGFAADASTPLVLEKTIPLNGVSGRIDHMAIDLARHRLAVAELGNDTLDVIDLDNSRAVGRITDLGEPQGVAFTADGNALVVANGDDGRCASSAPTTSRRSGASTLAAMRTMSVSIRRLDTWSSDTAPGGLR